MIRRPPRSTQSRSSAASDVYKRQVHGVAPVDGGLSVRAFDELLGEETVQQVDMVVLATGALRSQDAQKFSDMLKVPASQDGFFMEAHPKLRPLETAIDGVVLAGSSGRSSVSYTHLTLPTI